MMIDLVYRIQPGVDTAMAMLIWLVQWVIYPAFRSVDQRLFHEWHLQYMKTISRIVIPFMLIQALCHGLLSVFQPSMRQWVANAALLGAWIVTFTLSVPCHRSLQQSGPQMETIDRLIRTNWLRTLFWSLVLIAGAG